MVDLFNSAASQFTLAGKFEQEMFETYFKAIIGLRKSSPRSAWAPQIAVTKNAARIIGLNFASQLTPTIDDLSTFGIQEMLERVSKEQGLVWEEFFAKLKKNEQWHVEVY